MCVAYICMRNTHIHTIYREKKSYFVIFIIALLNIHIHMTDKKKEESHFVIIFVIVFVIVVLSSFALSFPCNTTTVACI